jgi:hypothetical protein
MIKTLFFINEKRYKCRGQRMPQMPRAENATNDGLSFVAFFRPWHWVSATNENATKASQPFVAFFGLGRWLNATNEGQSLMAFSAHAICGILPVP